MAHDLIIEHRRTCACNLHWQKQYPSSRNPEVKYTVVFGPTPGGPYAYGFSCDCPARVKCRHIKQAEVEKCDWGWEAFMGDDPQPNGDKICPECGGPTEVIKVGV